MNTHPTSAVNREWAAKADSAGSDAKLKADQLCQALAWFQSEVQWRMKKSKGVLPSKGRKLAKVYAELERLCNLGGMTLVPEDWKQFEATLSSRIAELTAQAKAQDSVAAELRAEAYTLDFAVKRR